MDIRQYLDSTYLKTSIQANISKDETEKRVVELVQEAIHHHFKLVMVRPEFVSVAKELVQKKQAEVAVGTVVGFHEGTNTIQEKLAEAEKAIVDGVDELDFVVNYKAFKKGQVNVVKSEVYQGVKLVLEHGKVIKWIIEIAALTNEEIAAISQLIRDVVLERFGVDQAKNVFVKSSTGFYKTTEGKPNGATFKAMELIVEHAQPLQIKAAGGVRTYEDAVKMIALGVTRIGTSSAILIVEGKQSNDTY